MHCRNANWWWKDCVLWSYWDRPRFTIVATPVIAYTRSLSLQTCGSIKFPWKVFWRGSFWPTLELQRNTKSYLININEYIIAKCMDVNISIDGSAEPLTPNPLPRNFNYKIITKIQASERNNKKGPLDKLEEYAVILKTLQI